MRRFLPLQRGEPCRRMRARGVEKSKRNRRARGVTQLSGRTPWGWLPPVPCERGTKAALSALARPWGSFFGFVRLSMDLGTSLNTEQPFVRGSRSLKGFQGVLLHPAQRRVSTPVLGRSPFRRPWLIILKVTSWAALSIVAICFVQCLSDVAHWNVFMRRLI